MGVQIPPLRPKMTSKEEKIALFCKKKEIEALENVKSLHDKGGRLYWSGKSQAFSQVWEHIVFEGKSVGYGITPIEYNKANETWSKSAQE